MTILIITNNIVGGFGNIAKVRRKIDGKILVCKEINYRNLKSKEKKQVISEVQILREMKSPYIVKYYDR